MRNHNIGSISTATLRLEDLIPSFLWDLQQQRPCKRAHRKLANEITKRMRDNQETYYQSEDADWDLEALTDALGEYAPAYFYFGAHPGDGADFGYWLPESFTEDFDGLKVSDLSEVPKGFSGEVLHVNDHGNMTLYAFSRGRGRELWGIV